MRRIITLSFALLIALWGLSIVHAGEPSALVALRDGLLVLLGAAVLFAVASRPLRSVWADRGLDRTAPMASVILIVLAATTALGSSAWLLSLLRAENSQTLFGWALLAWAVSVVVLGAAAFWPAPAAKQKETAWSVSAAERYLRSMDGAPLPPSLRGNRRALWIGAALITLVAAVLRIGNFGGLPSGCTADCTTALQALSFLREDSWRSLLLSGAPIYTTLVALVFGIFTPGLSALTWLGIILGTLSAPLLLMAGRTVARFPVALIGALILAFAPWHIALSRAPQPATLLILLVAAALWTALWAAETRNPQRWALVGLLAGLTALTVNGWMAVALLIWWFWAMPPARWRSRLIYWAGLLAGSAPALALLILEAPSVAFAGVVTQDVLALAISLATAPSLLTAIVAVLALLGAAHLLRRPRWAGTRFLLVGLFGVGATVLFVPPAQDTASLSPLFLTLLTLTALVALDQLVGALVEEWSTAARTATLTTAAATAAAVILTFATVSTLRQTEVTAASVDIRPAVGTYLREQFEQSVDNGGTLTDVIFVPYDVLQAPATQLAAGGVLPFAKRILPLDPALHLPLATSPFVDLPTDGDIRYVIPAEDRALLDYLGQIYPDYVGETVVNPDTGSLAAYVATVSRQRIEADRGINVSYFRLDDEDLTADPMGDADRIAVAGPLEFDWEDAPLPSPFVMRADGMLYIPEAGAYTFSAETDADAQLRVTLGDDVQAWTVIGDGAEETVTLPQGYFPIAMDYRTADDEPALSIRWQRPGGKIEPIPQQALYRGRAPQGVVTSYYAPGVRLEDVDDADPVQVRREPLLRPGPTAADAGTVVWQAKLAAPADGSYVFNAQAHGRFELIINGITLAHTVEAATIEANADEAGPVSAAVQLRRGWHDLLIRYEPAAGDASFVLHWQPAGYQETEIPAALLAPYPGDVDASALAIPDVSLAVAAVAPPAAFDLPDVLQSGENPLPTGLPELPLQLMWAVGACAEDGFQPRGVVLWPERNQVLAADAGNARVVAYDLTNGEVVNTYTNESWIEPFDLGRSLLGEVFLIDAVAQEIYQFDEAEDAFFRLPQETPFYRPRGMGVGADGSLVVADTGGARVVVLTSEGGMRTQYGGPDTALGQGQPVDALLQPNGALWVVTAEDGLLWRLDQGSGQVSTARSNTFSGPHLAGLPNNSVLVTDPERRLLTLYTAESAAAAQFQEGGFMTPVGIDAAGVDDQLLLAVSDSGACQVSVWQMPLADLP